MASGDTGPSQPADGVTVVVPVAGGVVVEGRLVSVRGVEVVVLVVTLVGSGVDGFGVLDFEGLP